MRKIIPVILCFLAAGCMPRWTEVADTNIHREGGYSEDIVVDMSPEQVIKAAGEPDQEIEKKGQMIWVYNGLHRKYYLTFERNRLQKIELKK